MNSGDRDDLHLSVVQDFSYQQYHPNLVEKTVWAEKYEFAKNCSRTGRVLHLVSETLLKFDQQLLRHDFAWFNCSTNSLVCVSNHYNQCFSWAYRAYGFQGNKQIQLDGFTGVFKMNHPRFFQDFFYQQYDDNMFWGEICLHPFGWKSCNIIQYAQGTSPDAPGRVPHPLPPPFAACPSIEAISQKCVCAQKSAELWPVAFVEMQ